MRKKSLNAGVSCVFFFVCLETELMIQMLEGNRFFKINSVCFSIGSFLFFVFFVTRTVVEADLQAIGPS